MRAIALVLGVGLAMLSAGQCAAEHWVRMDPNDPYGGDGSYHWFDVDSGAEDVSTGYVFAHGAYTTPAKAQAGGLDRWFLWAFDCTQRRVFYVGSLNDTGYVGKDGWREKGETLDEPRMGGVTNSFGQRLCALQGSWPKGRLP